MTKNRKGVENYILKLVEAMDPSGFNTDYYKKLFSRLNDTMFHQWMIRMKKGETKLYLYCPNMKVFPKIDDLMKAAEITDTQFFERVKLWDKSTRRYFYTSEKHLILKLPVRRLKQYLMGKISIPDNDRIINPTTGQVTGADKGSGISMTEMQTLDSKGLHNNLKELTNVRGGNLEAYNSMRAELEETGQASFRELSNGGITSAQTANTFLKAMHIDNNL